MITQLLWIGLIKLQKLLYVFESGNINKERFYPVATNYPLQFVHLDR
jgi:hypothetical protein